MTVSLSTTFSSFFFFFPGCILCQSFLSSWCRANFQLAFFLHLVWALISPSSIYFCFDFCPIAIICGHKLSPLKSQPKQAWLRPWTATSYLCVRNLSLSSLCPCQSSCLPLRCILAHCPQSDLAFPWLLYCCLSAWGFGPPSGKLYVFPHSQTKSLLTKKPHNEQVNRIRT